MCRLCRAVLWELLKLCRQSATFRDLSRSNWLSEIRSSLLQHPTIALGGRKLRRTSNPKSVIWLVSLALRSWPASVLNVVERGPQSLRRCLRSAAPTRDQHDGFPRLTQIHSPEYEIEIATATS